MIRQRTLKNVIKATGVGLRSGRQISLSLRPAPVNSGIVFRRIDLAEPVAIKAGVTTATNTANATRLQAGMVEIVTVEHILAACLGMGLDNVYIDVNAPELPVMDGSAAPFVFLIQSAGLVEQAAPAHYLWVRKKLRVQADGGGWAQLKPCDGFRMSYAMVSDAPPGVAAGQALQLDFASASFGRELSRARNLEVLEDLAVVRSGKVLTTESRNNIANNEPGRRFDAGSQRYPDEKTRHRMLDALGDLCLLGYRLKGAFSACQSDHALHHRLLRTLLADENSWEVLASGVADRAPQTDAERLARAG